MKTASTRLLLCLLALGFSGANAIAEPLTGSCPAPSGSTLAEFEACAPSVVKAELPAPVAVQAGVAAPVKVAPPVVIRAPVLAAAPVIVAPVRVAPVRAASVRVAPVRVVPVRVATAQRKTKRLTMIPWLVGAYQ